MAENEKKGAKKKNSGCLGCLAILGVISLTAGIYLLNKWDNSGAGVRTASVLLTTLGVLMMLPAVVAITIIAVVYLFLKKVEKSLKDVGDGGGEELVEENKKLYSEIHTFRAAEEDDFEDLDVGWYDETAKVLAGLGFKQLGDIVDETIEQTNGMVTPIRVFTSMDGTTGVAIYHFAMGLQKLLMVDVTTEFNNGAFVMTSNTADHDQTTSPPKLVKRKLPLETSVEQLLAAHAAERVLYSTRHPEATAVVINTLEEALESERRQQKIKNDFRQGIGFVDPEEVRRVSEGQEIEPQALNKLLDSVKDAAARAKRKEGGEKPDDDSKSAGV